jgi:hypothetical protein
MNRHQLFAAFVCFLALLVSVDAANAQSKDRDNPTRLTSNMISGLVDSDSRGNYYYYSFMAGPGEVAITLTVDPGKKVSDSGFWTGVDFSLFDRNAEKIAAKKVTTSERDGSQQAVARVEVTYRQLVVLSVHVQDGMLFGSVGGKYRIRIDGAVEIGQSDVPSKPKTGGGVTFGPFSAEDFNASPDCLPKQGTLIIKMKDGSKKIIDLSEAETITIVP